MPFNGSGTFTPYTPGNPVVTGTVISSTAFNATQSDLAAGLTNAITRDGQSPPTASLPMGGNKLTGLAAGIVAGDSLRWEQLFSQGTEQDIASAGTTDIGALNTTVVQVTGTTTITSFGTNYNGPRYVRFAGALTLTHNATTLILPTGANITTAAGDRAILTPVGNPAAGWQVTAYQRANGTALNGVAAGAVTSSGLTMATARVLGRVTASTGAIEELTLAQLVTFLSDYLTPAGTLGEFTGTSAPAGWLALPLVPTNISRTGANARLFAAIGTTWGVGDGSTTFGMPYCPADHVFVQANANVGTTTTGAVISHSHTMTGGLGAPSGGANAVPFSSGVAGSGGTTQTTGGSANLAAGMRGLYMVKL